MACWPANVTGAFVLALLIFDLVVKDWTNLPLHALGGIAITGLLWGLCFLLGSAITGGILVIPILAALLFAAGIWFTGETLRKKGCCVKCNGNEEPESSASTGTATGTGTNKCIDTQLKATPLT